MRLTRPAGTFTTRQAAAAAPRVIALLTRNNQSTPEVRAPRTRYWVAVWSHFGFRPGRVAVLVVALPAAPQGRQCEALGWLPSEVAWRRDLSA